MPSVSIITVVNADTESADGPDAAPVAEPAASTDTIESGSKAERTRALLIETALGLFRDKGFDAIATEASVSVGNAYYHFDSKEHLIQAFYDRAQVDHRHAAAAVLTSTTDLEARIIGVIERWIDVMEPYRAFAGSFFKNAADPTSPLSPFSVESAHSRDAAIDLWKDVINGSDTKVPKALRAELPELAWLFFMGIVLFWVHDRSDHNRATRVLVRRLAPTVVRVIGLARLPVLRATIGDLVALIEELKAELQGPGRIPDTA
jgi:AcrR family transcriptional regulator